MLRPRVIPCLLLKDRGLVKTVRFDNPRYVGDPLNAVRIFNEKEVDELVFLDTQASKENRAPDFQMIKDIASECFMPLAYGGGITTLEQIGKIFALGVEKVVLNSAALKDLKLVRTAATLHGSQSIVVAMDVKTSFLRGNRVYNSGQKKMTALKPVAYARLIEEAGAGEIFLNSVDRDGTMSGYDLELVAEVSKSVRIPVVACGGASGVGDFRKILSVGAAAAAAGSCFVFHGKHHAVLITYPEPEEFTQILSGLGLR